MAVFSLFQLSALPLIAHLNRSQTAVSAQLRHHERPHCTHSSVPFLQLKPLLTSIPARPTTSAVPVFQVEPASARPGSEERGAIPLPCARRQQHNKCHVPSIAAPTSAARYRSPANPISRNSSLCPDTAWGLRIRFPAPQKHSETRYRRHPLVSPDIAISHCCDISDHAISRFGRISTYAPPHPPATITMPKRRRNAPKLCRKPNGKQQKSHRPGAMVSPCRPKRRLLGLLPAPAGQPPTPSNQLLASEIAQPSSAERKGGMASVERKAPAGRKGGRAGHRRRGAGRRPWRSHRNWEEKDISFQKDVFF